jgi:hypothetical protein
LWTDWILEEKLRGARPKRLVLIVHADGDRWTFATLAILLNKNLMNGHFAMAPDSTQKQMETHTFLSLTGAAEPWSPFHSWSSYICKERDIFRLQLRQKENGCARILGGAWRNAND